MDEKRKEKESRKSKGKKESQDEIQGMDRWLWCILVNDFPNNSYTLGLAVKGKTPTD